MVSAFDLAAADKRTMALNLVSSDEGEVSIRDYRLHMRMLDYLRGVYPTGHITLDAGVDVLDEDGWPRLMRTMPIGM
jgi:adenosine deaminase